MVHKMVQEMESGLQEKITNTYERIRQEGKEEGVQAGLQAGRKEGINLKTVTATQNMFKEGFDKKLIARILEVSVEEIERIIKIMNYEA